MESSWSPADEPAEPVRLMRVAVTGGLPQFVLQPRNWWGDFQCSRAPGRICLMCELSDDRKRVTLTAFDPVKGRGKLLRTIEVDAKSLGYSSGLSPDGSTFAVAKHGEADIHIRLLSLAGGSDRDITVTGWPNAGGLDWPADGKGFYCGSSSTEGATLLYVDLKGTAQVLWRNNVPNAPGVGQASPNGRYLAIWDWTQNSDVWMLEGL